MKTIWTILALLAVFNILAVVGLVGWLNATDRLSRDRVLAVSRVFSTTVEQEKAEKAKQEAEEKLKAEERAREERLALPPVSAAEKVAEQQFRDAQKSQTLLRQQQELETLRASLIKRIDDLDLRERKLALERKSFDEQRAKIQAEEASAQFKVAMATLEGQRPKDAKQVLMAMLQEKQHDQVISFLNKMEEGKRVKVMAEFVKEDAALAADLLQRLQARSITPSSGGSAVRPGSDTAASRNEPKSTATGESTQQSQPAAQAGPSSGSGRTGP